MGYTGGMRRRAAQPVEETTADTTTTTTEADRIRAAAEAGYPVRTRTDVPGVCNLGGG